MVEAELKDILYDPSPNMAYLATANASAQIFLQETSDMPETLCVILGGQIIISVMPKDKIKRT